jgi:hypothetical protein
MALKTNSKCQSYAILKRGVKSNQGAMWQVEVVHMVGEVVDLKKI